MLLYEIWKPESMLLHQKLCELFDKEGEMAVAGFNWNTTGCFVCAGTECPQQYLGRSRSHHVWDKVIPLLPEATSPRRPI